jgi:hypothetical protein
MSISKIVGWWPQALIYGLMLLSAAFGSRYDAPPKANAEVEQRAIIPSEPVREGRGAELLQLQHGRHPEPSNLVAPRR